MPVIVIGADTVLGERIIEALIAPGREVRAFVTDPAVGARLKEAGVKVATGDVSDASHVGAACTNCFSVVLVGTAAADARPRHFADSPEVVREWARAVHDAGVRRAIWVTADDPPAARVPESAWVDVGGEPAEIASRVAELDDAAELPTR